jgi:transposase
MQLETLDATAVNIINEIVRNYEQQIKELNTQHEQRCQVLQAGLQEYHHKYLIIKEQYELLIYKKFVRSAEELKADESQPMLFTEGGPKAETQEEKETIEHIEVKTHKRNKKGRKGIDPKIERREKIIDLPDCKKTCACGAELTRIGEESSEKLVIIPMKVYVEQTIRPKYACRKCEGTEDEEKPTVRIMPPEPSIIPKSISSPSLLSCIMIQKYEDHLPFYRQEKQFQRIGVRISRQVMSFWQQKIYEFLAPLFMLFKIILKTGPVIQMDETTVQVIKEEGRSYSDKSYMWLARGGPVDKTVILYEYRQTRGGYNAKAFLEGYCGYLQTDGYGGYDAATKDIPGIIHVGCFAHARRYFFEAAAITKEDGTAKEGMEYIQKLYHIERILRNEKEEKKKTDEQFLRERKEKVEPVLNDFKEWLLKHLDGVPPSCLLGKAIGYSLNQWDKLIRYIESPYLTPDNNACENAIRPFVLGRKNWLFNQTSGGAESSCGMYSLIETAKQNGLVARDYLMALFEKAPYAKSKEDWEKLLPWNIFQKNLKIPEI